jgi:ATP synthase protein I
MQAKAQFNRGGRLSKPPFKRIFAVQIVVLLVGSAALLLVDLITAYSALLGGFIALCPNVYFAHWAFRYSGAQAASSVTRAFYRGEAGKFVLTAILFAGVFALIRPHNVIAIFLAYLFMTALNWMLALRFIKVRPS